MCLDKGIVIAADVADHVTPHHGDYRSFWFGELQLLCHAHHSGAKRQLENRGYVCDIDVDGYPLDGNHPFNRR
jgi:hypothetical protein